MGVHFRPATREEMAENHATYRARLHEPAPVKTGPRPRNVQEVLDLGNVVYFTFRGRAYGVPPLPWKAGQRLLLLWTEAVSYPSPLTPETAPRYFALIGLLPRLLWRHCRPTGWFRRKLARVGLLPNPFKGATEGELVELAAFFLARRSSSSIGPAPATSGPTGQPPSTSSTSWPPSARRSRAGSMARGTR